MIIKTSLGVTFPPMSFSTTTPKPPSLSYPSFTQKRAQRALACSSFCLALFVSMGSESVPLPLIAHQSGVARGFTLKSLSERRIESELLWLIKVGLLRREVDGQGITDSFRLTPLGKQIIQNWEQWGDLPKPTYWERCQNQVLCWLSCSL
jgi:hypothetical protein